MLNFLFEMLIFLKVNVEFFQTKPTFFREILLFWVNYRFKINSHRV